MPRAERVAYVSNDRIIKQQLSLYLRHLRTDSAAALLLFDVPRSDK